MDLDNIRPNFYEPIVNQKHTARPVWCDSQKTTLFELIPFSETWSKREQLCFFCKSNMHELCKQFYSVNEQIKYINALCSQLQYIIACRVSSS